MHQHKGNIEEKGQGKKRGLAKRCKTKLNAK